VCFSQTTYPKSLNDSLVIITKDQLKQVNIIFNEKDRLYEENLQFKFQIENYKLLVNNYETSDSVRIQQINTLKDGLAEADGVIKSNAYTIENLQNKNKLWKGLTIGGFTVSIGLLVLLLVK
jgi:hypothetical protein